MRAVAVAPAERAAIALFGYLNRWNATMATTLEPLADARAERLIGDTG